MNKFKAHRYWLITIFLSLSSVVVAATITTFTPNTPIIAKDVNDNFASLNTAIAALQSQVNSLPTATTVNNLSTTVSSLSNTVNGHTTTISSHTASINALSGKTWSCVVQGMDPGAPWQASCPGGYSLTGGGCHGGGNLATVPNHINISYPLSNTWQCDGASLDGTYAICCRYQ